LKGKSDNLITDRQQMEHTITNSFFWNRDLSVRTLTCSRDTDGTMPDSTPTPLLAAAAVGAQAAPSSSPMPLLAAAMFRAHTVSSVGPRLLRAAAGVGGQAVSSRTAPSIILRDLFSTTAAAQFTGIV
jgi:hypothetical protein